MIKKMLMNISICIGSALLLVCWGLLNLTNHTGADTTWVYSHVLLLAGYLLIFIGALKLHETIKANSRNSYVRYINFASVGLVLLGFVAFIGQLTTDLVVGQVAQTQVAMDALFTTIHDNLALHLAFYAVGPSLFFVGLLFLVLIALKVRALSRYAAIFAAVGITVVGVAFGVGNGSISSPLYPLGILLLIVGFLPLKVSASK